MTVQELLNHIEETLPRNIFIENEYNRHTEFRRAVWETAKLLVSYNLDMNAHQNEELIEKIGNNDSSKETFKLLVSASDICRFAIPSSQRLVDEAPLILVEFGSLKEVWPPACRALYGTPASPRARGAMVAREQDLWNALALKCGRSRVLGILEETLREGLVLRAPLVTEYSGQESHDGVDDHKGGKFPSREDVVPHRDDLVRQRVRPLIDALIATADKQDSDYEIGRASCRERV